MKQEIAARAGNFCGVCPLIGRLSELLRGVYRREGGCRPALLPVFSMARSDTHGIADSELDRTQRRKHIN